MNHPLPTPVLSLFVILTSLVVLVATDTHRSET